MLCWVLVANVWKCPRNQAEAPRVEHQPGVSHISNTALTSSRLSTSGVQLEMFIYYFYLFYFFSHRGLQMHHGNIQAAGK